MKTLALTAYGMIHAANKMKKLLDNLIMLIFIGVAAAVFIGALYLSGREVVRSVSMISEKSLVVPADNLRGAGNISAVFKRSLVKALAIRGINPQTVLAWLQGIYAAFMAFITLAILVWPLSMLSNKSNK